MKQHLIKRKSGYHLSKEEVEEIMQEMRNNNSLQENIQFSAENPKHFEIVLKYDMQELMEEIYNIESMPQQWNNASDIQKR